MKKEIYKKYLDLLSRNEDGENESIIKEIIDIANKNIPSSLYYYQSINEFSLDAFINNKIYFNTPNNFNDPYDCLVFLDEKKLMEELDVPTNISYFENAAKKICETNKIPELWKQYLSNEMIEQIKSNSESLTREQAKLWIENLPQTFECLSMNLKSLANKTLLDYRKMIYEKQRIVCFTEELFKPLMWSYYANNNKGFALEYDFKYRICHHRNCEKYENCSSSKKCQLFPIAYTNKKYNALEIAKYFAINCAFSFFPFSKFEFKINDTLAKQKCSLYKAKCWAHESEWRMWLPEDHKYQYITHVPKSIIFGCRMLKEHKEMFYGYAKKLGIKIYHMIVDEKANTYELKKELYTGK